MQTWLANYFIIFNFAERRWSHVKQWNCVLEVSQKCTDSWFCHPQMILYCFYCTLYIGLPPLASNATQALLLTSSVSSHKYSTQRDFWRAVLGKKIFFCFFCKYKPHCYMYLQLSSKTIKQQLFSSLYECESTLIPWLTVHSKLT